MTRNSQPSEACVQALRLLDHRGGDVDADRVARSGCRAHASAGRRRSRSRAPARGAPVGRATSATVKTCAISSSPVAKNSSTSQRPPFRPGRVSTAQSASTSARRSQSCWWRSRLVAPSPYRRPTTSGSGCSSPPSARIQGWRSSGSRGFSIANANRFACRGSTCVIPVTTGPGEPQDAGACAPVDLHERLRELELAEEADPVAGVRRERGDRLLDLALRPAVDVVRRARVRDAAGAEAVGRDRRELVLVDGAELDRDAHQGAVPALERERGDARDAVELEQRAVRGAAVVEPRRDDGQVEAPVRVGEGLGVLEAPLVRRELLGGNLLVDVRDRHLLEAELAEGVAVGRAAGDDQHAHVALDHAPPRAAARGRGGRSCCARSPRRRG